MGSRMQKYCGNDPNSFPLALVCFYDKTHTDLHGSLACAPFICTPAPAGNGDSNLCSTLLLEVLFTTTASTRVLALVVKKLLAPCTWAEETKITGV